MGPTSERYSTREMLFGRGRSSSATRHAAYYAFFEASIDEAEQLTPSISRIRLRGIDAYYFDRRSQFKRPEDLRTFFEELEKLLGARHPDRVWFLSLGWRRNLFNRIVFPQNGASSMTPSDPVIASLRASLERSRTRVFSLVTRSEAA